MNTTQTTETTACLLWALGGTTSVEEKTFESADEAKRYVQALRRRGRTAWVKGDRRYAKLEVA